jgi:hypothetical protein
VAFDKLFTERVTAMFFFSGDGAVKGAAFCRLFRSDAEGRRGRWFGVWGVVDHAVHELRWLDHGVVEGVFGGGGGFDEVGEVFLGKGRSDGVTKGRRGGGEERGSEGAVDDFVGEERLGGVEGGLVFQGLLDLGGVFAAF